MAEKTKKKRLTKQQRIAKVKRALKNFVPWDGHKSLKVIRATMVDNMFDRVAVLYFGKGKWTWTNRDNLNGVVEGYNIYAPKAAYALVSLRLLTRADADAFDDWFRRQEKKYRDDCDMRRASDIADEQGYKLVKKPARKAA